MVRMLLFVLSLLVSVPAPAQVPVAGDSTFGLNWQDITDTPASVNEMGTVPALAEVTMQDLVAESFLRGYRPATYEEAVAYTAASHPNLNGAYIVPLGSFADSDRGIVVRTIQVRGTRIRVTLEAANARWPAGTLFVLVRLQPPEPKP